MKSRFLFRVGLTALALAFSLIGGGGVALGQMACIDNCLGQLAECNARTGGSTECEDAYDACLEGCLSQ
jgi:hypothetical protein